MNFQMEMSLLYQVVSLIALGQQFPTANVSNLSFIFSSLDLLTVVVKLSGYACFKWPNLEVHFSAPHAESMLNFKSSVQF